MPNEGRIQIELVVDDKGTVKIRQFSDSTAAEMNKAEKSAEGFSSKIDYLKRNWLELTAGTAGAVAFYRSATTAFSEAEDAEMRLALAMKNAGTYTRENFEALNEYAREVQKNTRFEDDYVKSIEANLQTYQMSAEEVKLATQASLDLASAKKMDLMTASDLVGKAYVGETQTLARYGIVIGDVTDRGKKFEVVLKQINDRFGGTAQADLRTYAGQIEHLHNIWQDIWEAVGYALVKTTEMFMSGFGIIGTSFVHLLEIISRGLEYFYGRLEKLPLIGENFELGENFFGSLSDRLGQARQDMADFQANWETMWLSPEGPEPVGTGGGEGGIGNDSSDRFKSALKDYQSMASGIQIVDEQTYRVRKALIDQDYEDKKQEFAALGTATKQYHNAMIALEISHQQELKKIREEYETATTGQWMTPQQVEAAESIREYLGIPLMNNIDKNRSSGLPEEEGDLYWKDYIESTSEMVKESESSFNVLNDLSERTADAMEDNFSNFFYTMESGFKRFRSVGEAALDSLKRMTADLMGQMLRMSLFGNATSPGLLSALVTALWQGLPSITMGAHGMVLDAGNVVRFAKGGLINSPLLFPIGMAGEAGPEAVVPLARTPSGDLGVKSVGSGSGSGQPVIIVYNDVRALDASSVAQFYSANSNLLAGAIVKELDDGNLSLISKLKRL